MKLQLFAALLAGLMVIGGATNATADDLTLIADQSSIGFVGSKPDGKHAGGFKKFEVDATANFEEPKNSSLEIKIDTTSLWSDDPKLTNHLKSPDFFDVRNHPTITFKSTEIIPGEGEEGEKSKATIKGEMTMLGKTVVVEIPVEAEVTEESVTLHADFSLDRTKWGMTYGQGKIDDKAKVAAKLLFKR